MVKNEIIELVKKYLAALPNYGINPRKAVLFGSFAKGNSDKWSDIDLVVIAPEFDNPPDIDLVDNLWFATEAADDRIEPIPCGVNEWEHDDARPVLEIARREGLTIHAEN